MKNIIPFTIQEVQKQFKKADKELKHFGKTRCKFRYKGNKLGYKETCCHPAMGYGGMSRNIDCELTNCPRILHGDEG